MLQVERALTLIATGTLTLDVIEKSTNRPAVALPKTFNHPIVDNEMEDVKGKGKARDSSTAFSEAMWGAQTRSYARTVKALSESKYDEIVRLSMVFVSAHHGRASTITANSADAMHISDDDDDRAALGEGSDTESDNDELE